MVLAKANELVGAFRELIERTSRPRWCKGGSFELSTLAEGRLVTEGTIAVPGDAGFRERFAAAFTLSANAKDLPREAFFQCCRTALSELTVMT